MIVRLNAVDYGTRNSEGSGPNVYAVLVNLATVTQVVPTDGRMARSTLYFLSGPREQVSVVETLDEIERAAQDAELLARS
jgi:hypothetical protein